MTGHGLIRPHQSKLDVLFKLTDAVAILALYPICVRLPLYAFSDRDLLIVLSATGCFAVAAAQCGVYRSWRIAPQSHELSRLVGAFVLAIAVVFSAGYLLGYSLSELRPGTGTWLFAAPLTLCGWRVTSRTGLRYLRRHNFNTRAGAIVGLTEIGRQLAHDLERAQWTGVRIAGFFDDRTSGEDRVIAPHGCKYLGSLEALIESARNSQIDVVFIALPFAAERRILEFLSDLRDTTISVYMVHDYSKFDLLHGSWFMFGSTPVVSILESPMPGVEGFGKRIFDILFAAMGLMVLAPLLVLIAVAVKRSSPGPVIFKQRRYGLDGHEIRVWKFRTMTVCDDEGPIVQAARNDGRVTAVGRLLRRTSLDELPQLLNVLTGKMSIVGPRPHAVSHNEEFRKMIPAYMLRHKVKPGITGLAQINGCRGAIESQRDLERRIQYDMHYVRSCSLLLDLSIIVRTLWRGFVHPKAF